MGLPGFSLSLILRRRLLVTQSSGGSTQSGWRPVSRHNCPPRVSDLLRSFSITPGLFLTVLVIIEEGLFIVLINYTFPVFFFVRSHSIKLVYSPIWAPRFLRLCSSEMPLDVGWAGALS